MIGDWYAFRGHPYKCTASDIASIAECEEKGIPTDISEIPLTAEILEKNGFECNSNTKTFYRILSNEPNLVVEVRLWDKDTNVRIGKQCDGTFRVGYDWYINGMEIHYVHELQHALRLCGIEKEISLWKNTLTQTF